MLGFELLASIIYGRFVSSENLYPVKTVEQVEIVISIDMTGWEGCLAECHGEVACC